MIAFISQVMYFEKKKQTRCNKTYLFYIFCPTFSDIVKLF